MGIHFFLDTSPAFGLFVEGSSGFTETGESEPGAVGPPGGEFDAGGSRGGDSGGFFFGINAAKFFSSSPLNQSDGK